MFDKLQNGVERNSFKLENTVCHWKGCELGKFTDAECLFEHVKEHFPNSQEDTAPINRSYSCEWKACSKTYSKKRLLEQHVKSHTGDIKDEFFKVLLNDQAKALTVPSRQMRWQSPCYKVVFENVLKVPFWL